MRISDWSSDVCSSDLGAGGGPPRQAAAAGAGMAGTAAAGAVVGGGGVVRRHQRRAAARAGCGVRTLSPLMLPLDVAFVGAASAARFAPSPAARTSVV